MIDSMRGSYDNERLSLLESVRLIVRLFPSGKSPDELLTIHGFP